jgi:hypothetical protein
VADFYSSPGSILAKELGIPLVINVPGPFALLNDMCGFEVPAMKNASSCCGLVYFKRRLYDCYARVAEDWISPYQGKYARECAYDEVWMVNSFFGLEPAVCLPPNVRLIGPVSKPPN